MRKRLTAFVLSLVMALTLLPAVALAATGTVGENITWSIDGSTLTFLGAGAIPDYADNGAAVAAAFDGWYWDGSSANLVIGEGITRVGNYAFASEPHPSVTIAASVESIGDFAFNTDTALTRVTIENPNIIIAEKAFNECKNITSFVVSGKDYGTPQKFIYTNYVVPDGTTAIDNYAFRDNEYLETVVLPEGVTTIGASAFIGCINLKSVQLPSTLTSIGGSAFSGCTSLESIQLPNSLATLGDRAFQGCTSLTSLTVPKNITNWGVSTFADCTGLTKLTLSQGLTSIGASAFYNCPGLTSVTIPDSVTSIDDYAFRATGLIGVTIPKSVTYLGETLRHRRPRQRLDVGHRLYHHRLRRHRGGGVCQ